MSDRPEGGEMGLLKELKAANEQQREQVKRHGHGAMFEAAAAGAFGIGASRRAPTLRW